MEENIIISNLNDFIFCPRSIYFHNLYSFFDKNEYHTTSQTIGQNSHKNIDSKKYSSKKSMLQGIDVYSEELGLIGKIDIFDVEKKTLIERKNKIKKIYEGYYLQIYAQYFCMVEMGYRVEKLLFYSLLNNKKYVVNLPSEKEKNKLKLIVSKMKSFSLNDKFSQNKNKCEKCIYKNLCDYYTNDE